MSRGAGRSRKGSLSPRTDDVRRSTVVTDLGDGRNFLNAAVPDAMVALYGEGGTLSEIGLALKMGTPLVYLAAWKYLNENGLPVRPCVTTRLLQN